jgi:hypothetical protein
MKYVREALYMMRIDFFGAPKLSGYMRDAGFVNVTQRVLGLPIGGWAQNPLLRKASEYYQAVVLDGRQGIAMRPLTKLLSWSPESFEVFLRSVRKGTLNPQHPVLYEGVCGIRTKAGGSWTGLNRIKQQERCSGRSGRKGS